MTVNFALTDEQRSFRESVIDFAGKELNAGLAESDENGHFRRGNWNKCADFGILSFLCPKKYGGNGEDLVSAVTVFEALGYACKDNGLVHAIVTQYCSTVLISIYGTENQRSKYLGRLASGELIAAQAITEPDAGSDVFSMRTKAEKQLDRYVLSGTKIFISNGPIADLVTVFAVSDTGKSLFGGVSCFIVEKGDAGFRCGRPLQKMGLRTLQTGEIHLDEVSLPLERMLGKAGHGMVMFNEIMEWERVLMGAVHLGVMERILERCVSYAKTRKQFGQDIGKFQSISNKIADMKVNLELGKLILWNTGWLKDNKQRATTESSISKLFISESLKKACLDAVQIHGAYGFMREYEIERDLRDSIASTIYSGTSEIQRKIISGMLGL